MPDHSLTAHLVAVSRVVLAIIVVVLYTATVMHTYPALPCHTTDLCQVWHDRGRHGELVRVHGMYRCDDGEGVEDDLTEHPLSPSTIIHRIHAMATPRLSME